MKISYDPTKNRHNLLERGLSFETALGFDWGSAWVVVDDRRDYNEVRYQALGFIGQHLHMLVFTPRSGVVHIISLRRANRRERIRYAENTPPRTSER